jgi:hypothetical protein
VFILQKIFPAIEKKISFNDNEEHVYIMMIYFLISRNRHRKEGEMAKNEVYIGPTTFRRFMECFRCLYNNKSKERTQDVEQLK